MTEPIVKQKLLEALLLVRENPGAGGGICDNVYDEMIFDPDHFGPAHDARVLLRILIQEWPEASHKHPLHPVPAPGIDGDAKWAYEQAMRDNTMWDRASEYGAARWRLLDWLIEHLKEES